MSGSARLVSSWMCIFWSGRWKRGQAQEGTSSSRNPTAQARQKPPFVLFVLEAQLEGGVWMGMGGCLGWVWACVCDSVGGRVVWLEVGRVLGSRGLVPTLCLQSKLTLCTWTSSLFADRACCWQRLFLQQILSDGLLYDVPGIILGTSVQWWMKQGPSAHGDVLWGCWSLPTIPLSSGSFLLSSIVLVCDHNHIAWDSLEGRSSN